MEANKTIRDRDALPKETKWRLEDIFPTIEAFEAAFAAAQAEMKGIPALQDQLTPDPVSIRGAMEAAYGLERQVSALYAYARMRRDEDSRKPGPQAMADRVQSLAVQVGAAFSFLSPALLAMPEDVLTACLSDPTLSDYHRAIGAIVRMRPHTLPAEQEALLAKAREIGDAPSTIYTLLTEADMTIPSIPGEDGQPMEMSESRLLPILQGRNGRMRKDAYEAVMGAYGKLGNTFATIYAASVKNDVFVARARNFPSALEGDLFENEIPLSVYDALLGAVTERLPAINRYQALKQKAMGLGELHLWDLYAETSQGFDLELTYDQAYDLVLEATAPLGDDYVETLKKAKDQGWVDVYPNGGKHHGAYSWGAYGVHPFVLLNFEGTVDSASTLAHELGHAMHSYYSGQSQPFSMARYTLFAAEVASTVNEVLLSCYLLEKYKDPAAQQSLLGTLLEHYRTTVFRQTLFAAFEKETHAMQEKGQPLTKESLCDLYYRINEQFYGKGCTVDEAVRHEWMRIPHFYRAFYVYQYATGFSAAVAIARRILKEGAPAVEGYKAFLKAGSSLPPLEALRLAGVDMETPAPVLSALDWFEEIIGQFEKYI